MLKILNIYIYKYKQKLSGKIKHTSVLCTKTSLRLRVKTAQLIIKHRHEHYVWQNHIWFLPGVVSISLGYCICNGDYFLLHTSILKYTRINCEEAKELDYHTIMSHTHYVLSTIFQTYMVHTKIWRFKKMILFLLDS